MEITNEMDVFLNNFLMLQL